MGLFNKIFRPKQEDDLPSKPEWKPNLPNNIDTIIERAKYYTGSKLQLAVLEYGTVIYFPQTVDDIKRAAFDTINRIYNSHPDFKPIEMDDGNYIVEYSQPAFTIVFKEEIENHWNYIETNHKDGVCTHEVLLNGKGEANIFDDVGKICLFGRAKMFMDAQKPDLVRMFDPLNSLPNQL